MMKKRLFTLMLTAVLAVTMLIAPASAAHSDAALQAVQALGIMQGNENGDMMLSSNVTRAQFAAMMTRASVYKDTIGTDGSGYSLFKDVKSSHWASEYIRLVIQEGWVTGYIDGTFRPEQSITLEEACTMVLRLLGYDSSMLAGSFPSAQLNKASSLGLRDQISVKQGEAMTRGDCVQLFYNLLTAQDSSGKVYATTLGYTLTNGEVDYTAVVKNNLSGPYIADSGEQLPFTPVVIYRNGERSSSSLLNQYDVYYYNESMRTVWIYTDRASGKITALSPSSTSPTSVTIAGTVYEIGSSNAAYQLSTLGGGSTGTIATLLLGMDDKVVGIVTGAEADMMYYGIVQSYSKSIAADGDAAVETTVTIVCTDGATRTFTVDKSTSYTAGKLVSVNVTSNGVTIKNISERSISGKVNSSSTKLGDYYFADNVNILDTSDEGNAVMVKPERLTGCTISNSDVRYYALNEKDEIEHLILENVTGDTWTYGYLTSVEDISSGMNINITYEYLINGKETAIRSNAVKYPVNTGGIGISYNIDGSIKSMQQISSVKLTSLSLQSAMAGDKKFVFADDVQVYLRKSGEYYQSALSAINTENYTLTGWYDTANSTAGGLLRVIIAVEK